MDRPLHYDGQFHILRDAPITDTFDQYRAVQFPALRHQFDARFDERYHEFWDRERKPFPQPRLWPTLDQPFQPSSGRLELDLSVSHALGVNVSPDQLMELYDILVREMIIIRGYTKD